MGTKLIKSGWLGLFGRTPQFHSDLTKWNNTVNLHLQSLDSQPSILSVFFHFWLDQTVPCPVRGKDFLIFFFFLTMSSSPCVGSPVPNLKREGAIEWEGPEQLRCQPACTQLTQDGACRLWVREVLSADLSPSLMFHFFICFRLCQHLRNWPRPGTVFKAVNSLLQHLSLRSQWLRFHNRLKREKEVKMLNI